MKAQPAPSMPRIASVMTPFPFVLEPGDPLAKAGRLLAEHGFRHLPVVEAGRPVGLITDRDVERAGAAAPPGATIGDVRRRPGYVVDLSTPLDLVLERMAERHLDAAMVVKHEKLVGIFTLTDACRAFAEELRERYGAPGGDEVA